MLSKYDCKLVGPENETLHVDTKRTKWFKYTNKLIKTLYCSYEALL